jgi:P27 family predicted phage terminase small subunit
MGRRGPPPMPTKLKLLHGERRPARLNTAEPEPRRTTPRLPADLGPAARTVWRRVLREVGPTGMITGADTDVLRAYCEAVARSETAARLLDGSGPLVRASGTGARRGELVKNPLHQVVRDNAVLVRALARELGLTPSARSGLHAEGERDAGDAVDRWLRADGELG